MKSQHVIKIMLFILVLLVAQIFCQKISVKRELDDTRRINVLDVPTYVNQLVIVAVSEKDAALSLYEKNIQGKWEKILSTPAVIGQNGIGKAQEGDMKTPVGAFCFIKAFGIQEDPGARMDYVQVDESHYWVDDVNSKYYNQFVSTKEVEPDWVSAEHICEYGELYNYVLATSYNEECVPGRGSAVFLHCASEDTEYTAGCVAIPEKYMREILKRVESDCVLIIDTSSRIKDY